jgi:hypothetical protein
MRKLVSAGDVEPCETCGTSGRVARYEGRPPHLNTVSVSGRVVRDRPRGHIPDGCQMRKRR